MASVSDLIADLIVAAVFLGVPAIFIAIVVFPFWFVKKKQGKFTVVNIVLSLVVIGILLWLYAKALYWGLARWQGQAAQQLYKDGLL